MDINKLQYIFDPLCGWCYASAPALSWLAKTYPEQLQLLPSGLFSDDGARTLNAQWASHAWANDQRIASLTGQTFSEQYHQLLQSQARFDSQSMNRALTVFHDFSSAAEAGLLHALQEARYVRGLDTAKSEVVASIAIEYASLHQIELDENNFARQLSADAGLSAQTAQRIAAVQQLMNRIGVAGVPLLLATVGEKTHVINGYDLYSGPESISKALTSLSR